MRRPFIAGNWKMNLERRPARALAEELRESVGALADRDVAVFPTFISVAEVADALADSIIKVGGQNIHFERDGAFTGEVSAEILRSAGATHCIVGHSERRHIFGETDDTVNLKVVRALDAGLKPILCCGETLDEREAGETMKVVERQIRTGLHGVSRDAMVHLTVAYEPVWAIGTGKTATPAIAQDVHAHIRSVVADLYDNATAADLRIQYGGSVKPDNVDGLMAMPDVDGALVGGASLDAAAFTRIIRFEKLSG